MTGVLLTTGLHRVTNSGTHTERPRGLSEDEPNSAEIDLFDDGGA